MTIDDPFHGVFDSLESLADTIRDVLGCPVTIEDALHRLLAYSSHEQELTDQARLETIIGRRVPERVIHNLWKSGVIQALSNSQEPVRVTSIDSVGLGNRMAIAIRKDHDVLGYIWAIEAQPFTNKHREYLAQAARAALTKLLQLGARKRKEEEGQQEFFWRLLTGHIKSHSNVEESAQHLKVTLPATFCVVIFEFAEDITSKLQQQISYVVSITQRIRVNLSVTDRRQWVALIGPYGSAELTHQNCTDFIRATVNQLNERFGIQTLSGSSGSIYDRCEKIQTSYQEAVTVIKLKRQFPVEMASVFSYHDLGFYRFLPLIMQQEAAEGHVNYSLEKLREYDRCHHTCLLETLEVYLSRDNNPRTAAEVLHVHLNTLAYRLRRICEIGEVDLDNVDQKLSLYFDLKVAKLLKEGELL